LPAFVALSAIWGSSFLFIKVADRAVPPTGVALVRVAVGALTLLCVLGLQRVALPRGRVVWAHLAVVALIGNALPFSLIAYGETKISSVLAGIWNATTPLLTLLVVMVILREERPTRSRTLGLAIGFAGVVCLLGPWSGLSGGPLVGSLACFGAAALYAVAFPYTRRYLTPLGLPAASLAAGQLMCASLELALVAPLLDHHVGHATAAVVASLLALGALGTGIAYVLSYGLIQRAGATTASTVTYLIPVFATALGIIVLGESLQWNEPVGAAIVLFGVAVSQDRVTDLLGQRDRTAASEAAG
jgi:drug/metabolite transporter (DMT)-like permease